MAKKNGNSIVVALGGNALGSTPEEQLELLENAACAIVDIVETGANVAITHGNGPQVGEIYDAFFEADREDSSIPDMPFAECCAMSQGYIGYQLAQSITTEMQRRSIDRKCACIVTQVVVYPQDSAFQNPDKPIGPFYTEEEAKARARSTGMSFAPDSGRGWRMMVASPKPERIVEIDSIKDLMEDGRIVISCGGGGIPVFSIDDGYEGAPAVIDKDLTSARLASDIKADKLLILTAVDKVAINFGKPDQKNLDHMSVEEAREYMAQGQFAPGSMLPKVKACMEFLDAHRQGEAIICSLSHASDALSGRNGTSITWQ